MSDTLEVTMSEATPSEVRTWAAANGFPVGKRGHLPKDVIEAFNRRHRRRVAVNRNPWAGARS
jgi:hypothetical protein